MFLIQRRQDKLHLTPEPKVYTVYLLSEVCLDYIHLGQIVEVPWIGQLILQGQDETSHNGGRKFLKFHNLLIRCFHKSCFHES